MKNIFLLLCVLVICFFKAQEKAPVSIQNMSLDVRSIMLKSGFKPDLGVEGIPFEHNELFTDAKIGASDKVTKVRYNASLDQFEFLQNGQILLMGKEDWYSPVYLPALKNTAQLVDFTYKEKQIKGYLFENEKGDNVSLYRKVTRSFKKGEYAATAFDKDQPNVFSVEPDVYYLKLKDGKFVEFPKNKKKLIELFPDYKKSINDNVTSNDFDFNAKKQIVVILNKKSSE